MTRVAYLIHSAAPSGAELALGRALEVWPPHSTVEVHLAEDGPMVASYEEAGVTVHVRALPNGSRTTRRSSGAVAKARAAFALLRHALRLRRELGAHPPDVVVAGSLKAVLYGRLATAFTRTRFVWSVHDHVSRDYLGAVAPLFAQLLPRIVNGIVVNSRSTLACLSPGTTPVLVCPPGARLRRSERAETGPVRDIAVLGRLSPWKGQLEAVRAFASASLPESTRLHLVGGALFGEHHYVEEIRAEATRLGVAQRVVFHGHVDDPASVLGQMDVLAHTSVLPEPFGSVVLEGMDAGCIVIASAPGGTTEVVEDGRNGWLVKGGDVPALARAFERTQAMSADERQGFVTAGHTTAERFAIEATTPARAGFIRAVARRRALPGVVEWHEWTEEMDG